MSNALVKVELLEEQPKLSAWQRGKQFFQQKVYQVTTVGAGAMAVMGSAHAEEISVATFQPIITMITGLAAVVSAVGMAVLTVYATGKVFKWVKTAF